MTAELFQPTLQATTDNTGACQWTLPGPAGSGLSLSCTVSILAAVGGQFVAQIAGGVQFGSWSGPQPFGPITYQAMQTMVITGVGLRPDTTYFAQIQGVLDDTDDTDVATLPTSTGTTSLFVSDGIIDISSVRVPANSTTTYQYEPCSSWAGLRLVAMTLTGGPIQVGLVWSNQALDAQMGLKAYVLGAPTLGGSTLETVQPHLGDMLSILLTNDTGGDVIMAIAATHTSQPIGAFGGDDYLVGLKSIPNNAPTPILVPTFLYGGPAVLDLDPGSTGANYQFQVLVGKADGSFDTLFTRSNVDTTKRQMYPLILPAQLIVIEALQASGSPVTMAASLQLDLHRVG